MSEVQWMEQRSFENRVFFFRVELLVTLGNPRHRPCLPKSTYRSLVKSGDIRVERHKNTTFYHLSPRVVKLLESSKMTAKDAPSGLFELSPGGQPVPHGGSRAISSQEVKNSE